MTRFGGVPAFLAVLAFDGSMVAAQQLVPAVRVQPAAAQSEKPAQTELDKKLADIMKSEDTPAASAKRLELLERFIRDNPTFPHLESAYSNLLMFLRFDGKDPAKTLAIADEALKRFPDPKSSVRTNAIAAEYAALRTRKDAKGIAALSRQVLARETSPAVLEEAAIADEANALRMYRKAIAERKKNPSTDVYAWIDDLRWSYADCLKDAGRVDEALKIWTELVDVNKQQITTLEALPKGDPKRIQLSRARMTIGNRYTQLATFFTDRKEYDRALEYVKLAEEAGGYNPLEATASYANRRADVYAKAGKPDLEIDQRIHSLAARLDPKARDKILPLLEKTGTTLEAALARAGEIRKANAVAVKGFELKALDGRTVTLDAVRSNVTLVNFFFPT